MKALLLLAALTTLGMPNFPTAAKALRTGEETPRVTLLLPARAPQCGCTVERKGSTPSTQLKCTLTGGTSLPCIDFTDVSNGAGTEPGVCDKAGCVNPHGCSFGAFEIVLHLTGCTGETACCGSDDLVVTVDGLTLTGYTWASGDYVDVNHHGIVLSQGLTICGAPTMAHLIEVTCNAHTVLSLPVTFKCVNC